MVEQPADLLLPFALLIASATDLPHDEPGPGRRLEGDELRQVRAKRMTPDSPKIEFKDVAGADEAVEELHEIKEFLEEPKKFQAWARGFRRASSSTGLPAPARRCSRAPSPARRGVPFFSISGSDFVEMFVGDASRVRDLFEQAKQSSPCIIFMDEIDAVGRHRGAGLGGGHDEREQTPIKLLVEMDGFEMKDNIILIAATNRPDILDPRATPPQPLRPPDRRRSARPARAQKILEVHSKGKPLAPRSTSTRCRRHRASRGPTWQPDQRGGAARSATARR